MSLIESYLRSCGELTRFCSRDGWIDEDSVRFTVVRETGNEIIVDIVFDELLEDETGIPSGRITCRGQLLLTTDRYGQIIRAEAM
jgi:hypothetical protein